VLLSPEGAILAPRAVKEELRRGERNPDRPGTGAPESTARTIAVARGRARRPLAIRSRAPVKTALLLQARRLHRRGTLSSRITGRWPKLSRRIPDSFFYSARSSPLTLWNLRKILALAQHPNIIGIKDSSAQHSMRIGEVVAGAAPPGFSGASTGGAPPPPCP